MPNKPTSQFTAIATLDSADRIVAYEASESELRTVTGTVLLAYLGASLDLSTIASGGALPVARGGTGITSLGTGVATFLGTPSSANLLAAITDETGTGALVFANSPTLVTPALGTPASGVLTNCTGLPVAGGGTGRATGTTAYALIATGTTATGAQQSLAAGATTEILVGGGASALPVWTAATGSGAPVRATSPTLTTPVLGVAAATSLVCPTFTTASGAMSFTPAAGNNVNITLSGSGTVNITSYGLYVTKATDEDVAYFYDGRSQAADRGGVFYLGGVYTGTSLTSFASVGCGKENSTDGQYGGYFFVGTRVHGAGISERIRVTSAGNVGVAITAPTALMHLGASTTARASLCIPSGTAPTSPVSGDMWYNGTNLMFRDGSTTRTITWT